MRELTLATRHLIYSSMIERPLHSETHPVSTGWWWPDDVRTEVAPA